MQMMGDGGGVKEAFSVFSVIVITTVGVGCAVGTVTMIL